MRPLVFAARSLRRDLRQMEVATLALALVLAVAALTAVATLASRVEGALVASAAELLGGDVAVSSSRPLPPELAEAARAHGLEIAHLAEFPSVVLAGERTRLADIRAGDGAWPLRGGLTVEYADGRTQTAGAPPRGSAWADPALLAALDARPGDTIEVGTLRLRLAATLVAAPDSGDPLRIAPRLVLALDDALASGLLGPGSRVRHQLLAAGTPRDIGGFTAWLQANVPDGARVVTLADAQQNLQGAFERAASFLRLAALLAALLSGVAVALAAQRFARRKTPEVALLRCLGARRGEILAAIVLELGLLAGLACLVGLALGVGLQALVLGLAAGLLPGPLPALPAGPPLAALVMGFVLLLGFALPPLLALRDVPPLRVFRRDADPAFRRFGLLYLLPLTASALLVLAGAGEVRLAVAVLAAFAGVALFAAGFGLGLLRLVRALATRSPGAVRFGLANLGRRPALSLLQAGALALGLTALAALGAVGPSLLERWRADLPPDTPNWFLINLQPDQQDRLRSELRDLGADRLSLLPMAVGKLVRINGQAPELDERQRQRGDSEGEIRLSWSETLPPANRVVAGEWEPNDAHGAVLSVEREWARRNGLGLGDQVSLQVGEREIEARVASLREVDWTSFHPNFFLMLDAATGAGIAHSHIASFHLEGGPDQLRPLVRALPNLTLVDLNALLDRVRDIVERVASAVTWVLAFSLLAGLLVLLAALAATADERRFETALLRTLGARRRQLSVAVLVEFAALGLLAALIGTAGAAVLGKGLATWVFKLPGYVPPLGTLSALVVAAVVVVAAAGWIGTLRIAATAPMAVLRRG